MSKLPARLKAPALVALVLTVAHLVLAGLWVGEQELPTGARDEFFIVEVATDIAYRLGQAEWSELRRHLFDNAYYPPLVRLPAVVTLVLGGDYDSVVFAGWCWLPFLLVSTWILGRELSGTPWGGTVAVGLLLPAPGLADSIHHYESNLGVMAMSACCLAVWLRSDHFRDHRMAALFGLFLGLGLLADRLGVLPFVLFPCLLSLLRSPSRRTWLGLGVVALVAAVTAGWWYLDFFDRFLGELLPQFLSGEIDRTGALLEERPPLLWWWLHYLVLWPDSQLGLVTGLLAIVALCWGLRRHLSDLAPGMLEVLVWVGGGLLLFTLSQKRQVYYTLPLLPGAVALASALLMRARERLAGVGKAVALSVVLVAQLPALLTLSEDQVDLPPGLLSWVLVGQSPIPDRLIGGRLPLGGTPRDSQLDLTRSLGAVSLEEGSRIAVFSAAEAQVTESYQVSLGRIAIQSAEVYGLTKHPQTFFRRGQDGACLPSLAGPPSLLVFVHRGSPSWPTREQLVAAHTSHDVWKSEFECLAQELASWREGAQLVDGRPLADSEGLLVWKLNR